MLHGSSQLGSTQTGSTPTDYPKRSCWITIQHSRPLFFCRIALIAIICLTFACTATPSPTYTVNPGTNDVQFAYVDEAYAGNRYYYVRVIQADKDEHGNHSYAWSSPIWVKKK